MMLCMFGEKTSVCKSDPSTQTSYFERVMNKEDVFFLCWRVSLLTNVPPLLFVPRFPRSEFGSLKNGSRVRVEDWFYIN